MTEAPINKQKLVLLVLSRAIPAFIILPLLFFLPAGTFRYWEAWVYIACLLIPMAIIFTYLIKNDPELLARRMKMREKVKTQKRLIGGAFVLFIGIFMIPGLDHRFGWSHVPPWVVVLGLAGFIVGYTLLFLVLRENSYASRVIEVAQGQKVIDTGPYGFVRHPMYVSNLLMYGFTPLALGTYWALLPTVLIVPVLVTRILNEEKVLKTGLPGYLEYTQKVKYRLIPGIW